jgi:hypothetical protein
MVPSGPEPGARMYRWADQCRAMCRPATVNGDCLRLHWRTLFFAFPIELCGASARELRLIAMGRIVKLLSITPRLASRHQGLRKLSPHLISKAMIFYTLLPLDDPLCMEGRRVPAWGSALCGVAVAVIASHVMLPLIRFSWPQRALAMRRRGDGSAWLEAPSASSVRFVSCKPVRSVAPGRVSPQGHLAIANLSNATLRVADLSNALLGTATSAWPT